jgi:hypothetical protein
MATLYAGIREVPPSNLARKTGFPYDVFRRFSKIAKSDYYFRQSVCLSVYLSVHMERLGFYWKDSYEI